MSICTLSVCKNHPCKSNELEYLQTYEVTIDCQGYFRLPSAIPLARGLSKLSLIEGDSSLKLPLQTLYTSTVTQTTKLEHHQLICVARVATAFILPHMTADLGLATRPRKDWQSSAARRVQLPGNFEGCNIPESSHGFVQPFLAHIAPARPRVDRKTI